VRARLDQVSSILDEAALNAVDPPSEMYCRTQTAKGRHKALASRRRMKSMEITASQGPHESPPSSPATLNAENAYYDETEDWEVGLEGWAGQSKTSKDPPAEALARNVLPHGQQDEESEARELAKSMRARAEQQEQKPQIARRAAQDMSSFCELLVKEDSAGRVDVSSTIEDISAMLDDVSVASYLEAEGPVSPRYARARTAKGRRLARESFSPCSAEGAAIIDRATEAARVSVDRAASPTAEQPSVTLENVSAVSMESYLEAEGPVPMSYVRSRTALGRRLAREARSTIE